MTKYKNSDEAMKEVSKESWAKWLNHKSNKEAFLEEEARMNEVCD